LDDVDPLTWLTDVLTKIVGGHSQSRYRSLPWTRKQDLKAVD
jgi:hypothetical protein